MKIRPEGDTHTHTQTHKHIHTGGKYICSELGLWPRALKLSPSELGKAKFFTGYRQVGSFSENLVKGGQHLHASLLDSMILEERKDKSKKQEGRLFAPFSFL